MAVQISYYLTLSDAVTGLGADDAFNTSSIPGNSGVRIAFNNDLEDSTIASNISGSLNGYTRWHVFDSAQVDYGVQTNGTLLTASPPGSGLVFFLYPASSSAPCFLGNSQILCQVNGADTYVTVENMKPGMLVKTSLNGYKKVEVIGKRDLVNPATEERLENRLYKCSPQSYPELTTDLFITGCHSILVDSLTEKQKEATIEKLGATFVTDRKYRLMACVDERAEPWTSAGTHTIWHFALENPDEKMNYGVYANGGLLVETCSINFMKNRSNMILV
jgi:hypothetical protein